MLIKLIKIDTYYFHRIKTDKIYVLFWWNPGKYRKLSYIKLNTPGGKCTCAQKIQRIIFTLYLYWFKKTTIICHPITNKLLSSMDKLRTSFIYKKLKLSSMHKKVEGVIHWQKSLSRLPFTKELKTSSIYQKRIEVSSIYKKKWGSLPATKKLRLSSIYKELRSSSIYKTIEVASI